MNIFVLLILIFTSLIISLIISPKIRNLGIKYKLIDKIDKRKQKTIPMVRIGGVGIAFAYFMSISIVIFFNKSVFLSLVNDYLAIKVLVGSFFFLFIGMADDLIDISPFIKLLLQIIIAIFVFYQGFQINIFPEYLKLGDHILQIISPIITVIWIVGVTNAINWMDGLDGLATGFAVITSVFILSLSILNGQISSAVMISSLLGSNLGFLKYNFYPSKILMGDSGSYFLGFNLACISLMSLRSFENQTNMPTISSFAFIIAFMILSIPLLDMLLVIFSRIYDRCSPFYPDRRHLHHRILNIGLSEKGTVLLIYGLTLISSISAILIFLFK